MTTLADMTPEQREQCVGMWCDCTDGEGIRTLVLHGISDNGKDAIFVNPAVVGGGRGPSWTIKSFGHLVTPRPDLPRAWQADGKPVEMDVEGADYRPGTNRGFYTLDETIQKGRELPEGTTRARRFVGEWEEE